jgi:hypothetical protein
MALTLNIQQNKEVIAESVKATLTSNPEATIGDFVDLLKDERLKPIFDMSLWDIMPTAKRSPRLTPEALATLTKVLQECITGTWQGRNEILAKVESTKSKDIRDEIDGRWEKLVPELKNIETQALKGPRSKQYRLKSKH